VFVSFYFDLKIDSILSFTSARAHARQFRHPAHGGFVIPPAAVSIPRAAVSTILFPSRVRLGFFFDSLSNPLFLSLFPDSDLHPKTCSGTIVSTVDQLGQI
jgi:hypothetical protein